MEDPLLGRPPELQALQKMIKGVEGSMIRRISKVETSMGRIDSIENDLAVLKDALKNLGP